MEVTIRFTTHFPPNVTSVVIARLGGSRRFSHCMLIHDGLAYEATMMHGTRIVQVKKAMEGVAFYQDMTVEVPNLTKAIEFGASQAGKKYDFFGAFGIPFLASEDWGDSSKWWCSELVFAMLGAGGLWVLDPAVQKRVTPQDLLDLNYPKTLIINHKTDYVLPN